MKSTFKLPLYLGLAVLVVSILVSAVKIGNQQAFTSDKTRANMSGASLVLRYTPPNLVSVILSSDKEVKGADIKLKYNADRINILPSSLTSTSFITTGGNIDKTDNTYSFSALTKNVPVTSGILATFTVQPREVQNANGDIQFVQSETQVIERNSGQNILNNTQGIKFSLTSK